MKWSRAKASEMLECISESQIEKYEDEKTVPRPEDVVRMSEVYKKPDLCNYYCTHECRIGQDTVAEIHPSNLAELSLGIFNSLNALNAQKDRLMEIAEDGTIRDDEAEDFIKIQENLNKISITIESLKLWISQAVADGKIKPLN